MFSNKFLKSTFQYRKNSLYYISLQKNSTGQNFQIGSRVQKYRLVDWQYFIIRQFNPPIHSWVFYHGIHIRRNILMFWYNKLNQMKKYFSGYGSDNLIHGQRTSQVKFIMSSQNTVWNHKLVGKEFLEAKWQKQFYLFQTLFKK